MNLAVGRGDWTFPGCRAMEVTQITFFLTTVIDAKMDMWLGLVQLKLSLGILLEMPEKEHFSPPGIMEVKDRKFLELPGASFDIAKTKPIWK